MLCSQNIDLWDACASGDVAGVKRLLSLGADPNHAGNCVSYMCDCVESRTIVHVFTGFTCILVQYNLDYPDSFGH